MPLCRYHAAAQPRKRDKKQIFTHFSHINLQMTPINFTFSESMWRARGRETEMRNEWMCMWMREEAYVKIMIYFVWLAVNKLREFRTKEKYVWKSQWWAIDTMKKRNKCVRWKNETEPTQRSHSLLSFCLFLFGRICCYRFINLFCLFPFPCTA